MDETTKSLESLDSVDEQPGNLPGKKLKSILKKRTLSPDIRCAHCQKLQTEVNVIRRSLDDICLNLSTQHKVISRDFEERIRHVYDDVISDINTVRNRVNYVGDDFSSSLKYRVWRPLTPFRKEILRHAYEIRQPNKLTASKSVDFVDANDYDSSEKSTKYVPVHQRLGESVGKIYTSTSSVGSLGSSRSLVPGYGCCFNGDGKTVPYRSHRMWHSMERSESLGTSRSGSAGSMLDSSADLNTSRDTCLCGDVTDDWRAKVAPHMWGGWSVPGLDLESEDIQRKRHKRLSEIRQEVFDVHNQYRKQYGVPVLTLNSDLATNAQEWAENLARRGYAQYSNAPDVGENILVVDIEDELTGQQIVDTWYREKHLYNFSLHRWQRGTCNFTQIIWRSSKFAGVGIAKFPHHNTCVVVVQYQPPGNINTQEQYRYNVSRPINSESDSPVPRRKHAPFRGQTLSRYSLPQPPMMGQPNDISFDSGRSTNGSFDTTLDESINTLGSSAMPTLTSPKVFPQNPYNRHFTEANASFDTTLTEETFQSSTNLTQFAETYISRSQENISHVQNYPNPPRSVSLKRKNKTVATLVQRSLSVSTVTVDKPDESYFCILEKGPITFNRTLSCNVGGDKRSGFSTESNSSMESNGHATICGQLLFSSGWVDVGSSPNTPVIEEKVEPKGEHRQEQNRSAKKVEPIGINSDRTQVAEQTRRPATTSSSKELGITNNSASPRQTISPSISPFVNQVKPYPSREYHKPVISNNSKIQLTKSNKDPFAKETDMKPKSLNTDKFDELVSRMRSKYLGNKDNNPNKGETDADINNGTDPLQTTLEQKSSSESTKNADKELCLENRPDNKHAIRSILKDINKELKVVRTGKLDCSSSESVQEKANTSLDDSTDNVVFTYSMKRLRATEPTPIQKETVLKPLAQEPNDRFEGPIEKKANGVTPFLEHQILPKDKGDRKPNKNDDTTTKSTNGTHLRLKDAQSDNPKAIQRTTIENIKEFNNQVHTTKPYKDTATDSKDKTTQKQQDNTGFARITCLEKETDVPAIEMKDQASQTSFRELTVHKQTFSVGDFKNKPKDARASKTGESTVQDIITQTNVSGVSKNESFMSEESNGRLCRKQNNSRERDKSSENGTLDLPSFKKYKLRSSSQSRRGNRSPINTQRITMSDVIYNDKRKMGVNEAEDVKMYVKDIINTAVAKTGTPPAKQSQDLQTSSSSSGDDGQGKAKQTPVINSADERRPKMYNVNSNPHTNVKQPHQVKNNKGNLKEKYPSCLAKEYPDSKMPGNNIESQDFDCPRGNELDESGRFIVTDSSSPCSKRESDGDDVPSGAGNISKCSSKFEVQSDDANAISKHSRKTSPENIKTTTDAHKSRHESTEKVPGTPDALANCPEDLGARPKVVSLRKMKRKTFVFDNPHGRLTPVPENDSIREHTVEIATGNRATFRELSFDDDDSLDRILSLLGEGIEAQKHKQFSRHVVTQPTYKRDVDFN